METAKFHWPMTNSQFEEKGLNRRGHGGGLEMEEMGDAATPIRPAALAQDAIGRMLLS